MSNNASLVLAVVVTLTAAVAAPGPAQSQPSQGGERVVVRIRVPVGDLDLSNEAGADTLLQRVRAAAARACSGGASAGVTQAAEAREARRCRADAVSRTVAQVDSPVVQARYAASQPQRPVRVAQARP